MALIFPCFYPPYISNLLLGPPCCMSLSPLQGNSCHPLKSKHSKDFYISLPLPSFINIWPATPMPVCNSFISHLQSSCESWERNLWCDFSQHGADNTLLYAIESGAPLIISSDATTNTAKSSCFAWSISSGATL